MDTNNKTIIYYWYDHLLRNRIPTIINSIKTSIDNHDFESFMVYYNSFKELDMLPKTASVFTKEDYVGSIDITIKENFMKINYNEYECG